MILRLFLIVWVILSCFSSPPTKIIVMPPTKKMRPDLIEETIYSKGYMSEYDIWEFLRTKPSEVEVLETFGLPDSVWLDDLESTKFIYYFVDMIQDYNTIEISTKTDSVSGFEWD
jgi:hypothetical protein